MKPTMRGLWVVSACQKHKALKSVIRHAACFLHIQQYTAEWRLRDSARSFWFAVQSFARLPMQGLALARPAHLGSIQPAPTPISFLSAEM